MLPTRRRLTDRRPSGFYGAAVQFIADCLAVGNHPDQASHLRKLVAANAVSWDSVIDIANEHALAPALWDRLSKREILPRVPPSLRSFLERRSGNRGRHVAIYLEDQYRENLVRNVAFEQQARTAIEVLNGIGVEPLMLKGAALLLSDAPMRAWRVLRDLDICVPAAIVRKSAEALEGIGYVGNEAAPSRNHHHHPPLFLSGRPGPIEIHSRPVDVLAECVLSPDDVWRASEARADGCLRWRVLPPAHHLLVNLLHAQISNRNRARGGLALRDLHEFAWLMRHWGDRIDLSVMRGHLSRAGLDGSLDLYRYLAARLFRMPLEADIAKRRRFAAYYYRCIGNFYMPRSIRRTGVLFDRARVGLSAPVIVSRYGGNGSGLSLWAARYRHIKFVWRANRGAFRRQPFG